MDFIVLERFEAVPASPRPLVVLRANTWNDYSFRTLFGAELHHDGEILDLEGVKIMKRGQVKGPHQVPTSFVELDESYCSLGQEVEYYEKLMTIDPLIREQLLRGIRDVAADPTIAASFEQEPAWGTSVLRFGQATNALKVGPEILRGQKRVTGIANFTYNHPPSSLNLVFDFDDTTGLPGRTNVVIGYNGVGKTSLLAGIANAISQVTRRIGSALDGASVTGTDNTFGAVITVSYSPFDTFALGGFSWSKQHRLMEVLWCRGSVCRTWSGRGSSIWCVRGRRWQRRRAR
ncbi:MAG TPA: hypothetical protein VMF51_11270, partial [Nocardioides sp.]|uniref:hypothetical protein n=1 Tax=Nocardioides sp. TaxID=35761 RepID=UPI002C9A90CC